MDSLDLSSVGEALVGDLGPLVGGIVLLVAAWLPLGSIMYMPPVDPI